MMRYLVILFFFVVSGNLAAQENILWKFSSGILIEPFALQTLTGEITGELSNQSPSTNNGVTKYEFGGQRYGLRTAWLIGRVALGVELTSASPDYKYSQPSGATVADSEIDLFLYNAFIMYRGRKWVPWLGIVLDGTGEDVGQSIEFKNAGGLTAGLGYKLTKWFQVNLEFRSYAFKEITTAGITETLPNENRSEFNANEFSIGISIPIELLGAKGQRKD